MHALSFVDPTIEKQSDRNHLKKNLANQLYALQKVHKSLTTKIIKYIQKCWNYMVAQNVGNEDGISTGLDAMYKHPFGDHSSCGDWCSHRENPNMNYKSLPYGKCLSDSKLQSSLLDLFTRYKGISKKLAHMGSTQANESLNMTIASKAPKRCHFSGSACLGYRVAAGVAQKNIGHSYVAKVNIRAGLSPGTFTHKLAVLRDLQHRKRKAIANTVKAKRRRMNLKAQR
ncbi:uncharacterized protein LOC133199972 [Saccostrea echinata]|uniref:uncharacterized protein LOC133199972 n=1 Tax=Saccostrea echinata TaxID=191078 RepID=UPI002A8267C9|nr:uncharacterized protein LOC133199972 [Saccostrea echinata]